MVRPGLHGDWEGSKYQERFDELAASGVDVHGEADFVSSLGPRSVLDAGCGTGRVARQLAARGIEVVGVDAVASMIEEATRLSPELDWVLEDLVDLALDRTFDVAVMAGNVVLFTEPGTNAAVVAACARHLAPGGALVSGFQLGRGYELDEYDAHCAAVGLTLDGRWATWDRDDFPGDGSYAVSLHRSPTNG